MTDQRSLPHVQAELLAWLLPEVTAAEVDRSRHALGLRPWRPDRWCTLTALVKVAFHLGYILQRHPRPGNRLGRLRGLVRLNLGGRVSELLAVDPDRFPGSTLYGAPNPPEAPWVWWSKDLWESWARDNGFTPTWATLLTLERTRDV